MLGAAFVRRRLALAVLFLAALPVRAQEGKPAPATYEVDALSYGILPGYETASLVAGADPARRTDLQMMVWLLRGPGGRNVLVDTGCYREAQVKEAGLRDFVAPSAALARVGLTPEEVTDIIVTHMHWDHVGGVSLFPKARIWIQKDEYAYYTGAAWQPGGQSGGIEPEDVLALVRLNMDHRVVLVDGDGREILDGITVYTGGRHTFASQYVGVRTKVGTVVVASDNVYLYENLQKHLPIAQTFDAASNLQAQDRMRQIASREDLIVPGHDPEVFVRFPRPGHGVARIAP